MAKVAAKTMAKPLGLVCAALLAAGLLASGGGAAADPPAPAPPAPAPPAMAKHAMVAAANPHAAQAGLDVLKAGGSAIDAAVAVQAVLGLVEPQSSGIAGGAFLVYYDAHTKRTTAYDGREAAPAGASADMFIGPDGKSLSYVEAILSGRSTGAPGVIAMLALAQREHGRLAWRDVFGEGERLANDGFVVSPRLAGMIALRQAPQPSAPDMAAYFRNPDGTTMKAGDTLKNPAYAKTLRLIADQGPDAFYKGRIAADIAARVHQDPLPGTLSAADIAAYRPREAPALCRPYRVWRVCTANDPSGGSALLEALGLIERTDIASRGPSDPIAWSEFAQATRLMYADRDRYIGDPAFVSVPTKGLLDPAYLDQRAKLVTAVAGPPPSAGSPPGAPPRGPDHTLEPGGTSHFVIVDADGDIASMTTSVESIFGSGRMTDGFVLNNQLTDFSFSPKTPEGEPAANAVAPGKRPRSAMSPVIVFDRDGRFVLALGSPGGPSIIAYNLKAMIAILDWKLTAEDALSLPNLVSHGPVFTSEAEKFPPGVVDALAAKGIKIVPGYGENSGLHAVVARPGGYEGGADPRREGVAVGY
jgi:gamma-glutamyltranspeptidase/glutathione hydrolase